MSYDVVVPADPIGNGGNAYGVWIDGILVRLAGEPAPYPVSVKWSGNVQT